MDFNLLSSSRFVDRSGLGVIVRDNVDYCIEPHAHEFIELAYIVSGKGTHIVDGISEKISRGNLILLSRNAVHEFRVEDGNSLVVYNYVFQPHIVDPMLAETDDFIEAAQLFLFGSFSDSDDARRHITLEGIQSTKIEQLLFDIYDEYRHKEDGYQQAMRSQMTLLLILIFRKYKEDMKHSQDKTIFKKLMVESTVEYLKIHYADHITAEMLAGRNYVSESYLGKVFKDYTGMTPFAMLQNIRVQVACDLLENTGLSVVRIAEKTGYSDLKSFYQAFSKKTGLTPKQYRLQKTGSPR